MKKNHLRIVCPDVAAYYREMIGIAYKVWCFGSVGTTDIGQRAYAWDRFRYLTNLLGEEEADKIAEQEIAAFRERNTALGNEKFIRVFLDRHLNGGSRQEYEQMRGWARGDHPDFPGGCPKVVGAV